MPCALPRQPGYLGQEATTSGRVWHAPRSGCCAPFLRGVQPGLLCVWMSGEKRTAAPRLSHLEWSITSPTWHLSPLPTPQSRSEGEPLLIRGSTPSRRFSNPHLSWGHWRAEGYGQLALHGRSSRPDNAPPTGNLNG